MLDRTAAKWDAVQPQFGGQFNVTTSFFKAHGDIIQNMTVAKYNTALLIPHVGREITVVIQDGAIDAAIQDIDLTKTMLKHQEYINKNDKFIEMLSSWNKYSVVAYPVCYHFDVFIGGCMSLENKICFSYDINKNENHIGRGGKGSSKFVFALLDHSDSRHKRSRSQYVAAGGTLIYGQRLTETMWIQQFGTLDGYLIQKN